MTKKEIEILFSYTCLRCDHQWVPRVAFPHQCPKCKSKYWDRKRESRATKVVGSWLKEQAKVFLNNGKKEKTIRKAMKGRNYDRRR